MTLRDLEIKQYTDPLHKELDRQKEKAASWKSKAREALAERDALVARLHLIDRLAAATAPAFRPGIYRHWKGGLYRALFLAQDSTNRNVGEPDFAGSTEEPMVVYISLDPGEHQGNVCVRSLAQWNERVPGQIVGDQPRFEFVRD